MRRIIGLLSWWDESPTWLAATVTSMARVCDHIVALDGRYALFPDTRTASPQQQADAIACAAYGAAVGLTLVQPRHIWADEMEKRTALFQYGAVAADTFTDWYLIMDADEVLAPSVTQQAVHMMVDDAEQNGAEVVQGLLLESIDDQQNPQMARISRQFATDPVSLGPSPRLWRALDDMRVAGYHYHYSGCDESGQRVVVWNRDGDGERAAWHHSEELIVETRCLLRSAHRAQQRVEYYGERDRLKVEQVQMTADKVEAMTA